jgi:hypothetical protein
MMHCCAKHWFQRVCPVFGSPFLLRKATVALTIVDKIPAEGAARAPKRARFVWVPFPTRFRAGNDVHFESSLSERQTLFVESDEEGPVYIVPRNDGTQVYIARHLACRHTVRKLSYAESYLATVSPNRPVRYYCPYQDHEDNFFIVLNKEESMVPLTSTFPFEELRDYALSNSLAGASQVQRQSAKVNRALPPQCRWE